MRSGYYNSLEGGGILSKSWTELKKEELLNPGSKREITDRFISAMQASDSREEEEYIWELYTTQLTSLGYNKKEARKYLKHQWAVYTKVGRRGENKR